MIVGEEIETMMNKVERLSVCLNMTIEGMKDMRESSLINKVVRFTKDTKAEVEELKKSLMKMLKKVVKETESHNAE